MAALNRMGGKELEEVGVGGSVEFHILILLKVDDGNIFDNVRLVALASKLLVGLCAYFGELSILKQIDAF